VTDKDLEMKTVQAKGDRASGETLTAATFQFFRDLSRNNSKKWMDANRDRYQEHVVAPVRALLDALAPAVLKIDRGYVITGRTNDNFSRINRDIRFAKDKTPYYTRLYVKFPNSPSDGAELYVGVSPDLVTAGFRIYGGSDFKKSPLAKLGQVRALANPKWIAKQKTRLGKKYESYWHSMQKGDWIKTAGWPGGEEEWKQVRAWIVRRVMKPAAATKRGFVKDVEKIFKDVAPLASFCSSPKWKI
jgi:uncharacterized protein (TIGR02453 family)